MKMIVLVAVLAAAGCSKKGSDCDAAITKGMDTLTANMKEHAPNPQFLERAMSTVDKMKTAMVGRCTADNWSPEALTCFSTAANQKDMQGCQSKLQPEQQTKLKTDMAQVMMGAIGSGARPPGMPQGMAGHPGTLSGNGSAAPAGADPGAAPAAPAGSGAAPAAGAAAAPAAGGSAAGSGGW